MITLEQVQLLEARVSKTIEYVDKITAENSALLLQREELQYKLDLNQKRIDELEVLVMRFKEDQGRIEDGIIAALNRLSQFEEAFENSLKDKTPPKKTAAKPASGEKSREKTAEQPSKEIFFEIDKTDNDLSFDDDLTLEKGTSSEGELDIF